MNLFSELFLLQRLDYLLRNKATGTPAQLAGRLQTCERNIYRLIGRLRDQGFPIAYDKQSDTYFYTKPVKIMFDITVGEEKLLKIQGGEKNINYFIELPNLGTQSKQFCCATDPGAFRARDREEHGGC